MKAFLLHPDRDFDLHAALPPNAEDLVQDLELQTLFDAMARGDEVLLGIVRPAVLSSLGTPEAIAYRQEILRDCLAHPAVVREMYAIAEEAIEGEKRGYHGIFFGRSPDAILLRSVRMLNVLVDALRRLRGMADAHSREFRSAGFVRLFDMLSRELDDAYFRTIEGHLRQLRFRGGILISAELGEGNKGTRYVLRKASDDREGWWKRVFGRGTPAYSFEVADRDESGHQALSELRARGINLVANALAQSTDHILSFFTMLRTELGFYVGCLNLGERLAQKGEPVCFPEALPSDRLTLSAQGLYDVCLALRVGDRVVGNDLGADGRRCVMVTGANQGGKSTFLRSLGLAYLMAQCGMFAAAEQLSVSVCAGVFTHFKREEDAQMQSGKLDEELGRMSQVADQIAPGCVLLSNESFSSTNEREGSEIARQVIRALVETGVRVFFVTHLFDLAQGFHRQNPGDFLFLRAERRSDGQRTFRVVEGEPLPTSYGADLYAQIFGAGLDQLARSAASED